MNVMLDVTKLSKDALVVIGKTHDNLDELYEIAKILECSWFNMVLSERDELNDTLINYLLEHESESVYNNLAKKHVNSDSEKVLVNCKNPYVLKLLSENVKTSGIILDELAHKGYKIMVAANPSALPSTLDWILTDVNVLFEKCLLEKHCIDDGLVKILIAIAANPSASEKTLERLACWEIPNKLGLRENVNLSDSDYVYELSRSDELKKLSNKTNLTAETLIQILVIANELKIKVASNPSISEETMWNLKNWVVALDNIELLISLLENPNVNGYILASVLMAFLVYDKERKFEAVVTSKVSNRINKYLKEKSANMTK